MPYILQEDKDRLNKGGNPWTPGELTYLITKEMLDAQGGHGPLKAGIRTHVHSYIEGQGHSFATYSAVMGCLCCAHEEYRRRGGWGAVTGAPLDLPQWPLRVALDYSVEFYDYVIAPYEDRKIRENGDVFV